MLSGYPSFTPLVHDPHWQTILAHFWPRRLDTRRFPARARYIETEPGVQVLVKSHRPHGRPRGELVLVHGMESSSEASYMLGMAQAALASGYAVHRFNIRSCGGTERLCPNLYHGGLTADLRRFLETLGRPAFVTGYSLGGNIVLKLAGELGERGAELMAGICAVSAPIDLLACAARLGSRENRLYERRFVRKLGKKVEGTGRFPHCRASRLRSVRDLDEQYTAVLWGFRGASDYYQSQSSQHYLADIRVRTLMLQARDDPIIPFESFRHPAIRENRLITMLAAEHGGHLGFLSRRLLPLPGGATRFWSEAVLLQWMSSGA